MQTETLSYCPLCQGPHITVNDVFVDVLVAASNPAIWRCSDCRVCFLNPRIVDSEQMYDETDVTQYVDNLRNSGMILPNGQVDRQAAKNFYPEVCELASRVYDGSMVLDVGCGVGMSTAALHACGIRACGIDINEKMIAAGREVLGIDLVVSDISSVNGKRRIITANSVLEHVHDAVGFLKTLRAKTEYLVITVPNVLDIAYVERGQSFGIQMNWAHVWYFEESTLERALNMAAFQVVEFYRPAFTLPGVLGNAMRFVQQYLRVDANLYGGIGCLAK